MEKHGAVLEVLESTVDVERGAAKYSN